MANVPTERIRNIVLLSHSGAGKTILAEAMLHTAGVTSSLGYRRGRHNCVGLRG